ncbi:hypothetical protein NE237_019936 [Protea cynaroides]|uniref:Uncharacterized protein n=1 Tax=Protea cynaroides TaxID=273540 RepID=A0A9Q0H7F6_9MAGN|nr:hypothetical protein NE237_019936 [Protea cynaroides]
MPPSRGADRIGVSLGSHRPTVILKLPCLVEKKRTKVRSLAVLFSAANWDRSPARSDWSNITESVLRRTPLLKWELSHRQLSYSRPGRDDPPNEFTFSERKKQGLEKAYPLAGDVEVAHEVVSIPRSELQQARELI